MDRALWFLLRLRLKGALRRFAGTLKTVRGAAFVTVWLIVLGSLLASTLFSAQVARFHYVPHTQLYGPLILFVACLFNLLFAAGEQAVAFSPAEVNFLFPGPFPRRQLLTYKVVFSFGSAVLLAGVLTLFMRVYTAWLVAAYVGLLLTLFFLQLFSMCFALTLSLLGTQAHDRRRKWILGLAALLGVAAAGSAGTALLEQDFVGGVRELLLSPVMRVVLAPFRVFIEAFTADTARGLLLWSSLALLVDGTLLAAVYALDASFLETAAAASERTYARLEQVRSGGPAVAGLDGKASAGWALPALPWWGGSGPVLWRQLTAALRSTRLLFSLVFVFGLMAFAPSLYLARQVKETHELEATFPVAGMLLWLTLVAAPLVPFDFRGDLDRLDILKSLPVRPARLVLGQLAAPVALVTVLHWLVLTTLWLVLGRLGPFFLAAAAYVVPLNLMLFGVENLLFLLYPTRLVATSAGDFQTMGRQMLLFLLKSLSLVAVGTVAGLVVFLFWWVGPGLEIGLAAAWFVLTGVAAALIPLIALAFERLDVSRDLPP